MPNARKHACWRPWISVVAKRRLVEHRQVPDVEVDRPGRERHQRVGEHAELADVPPAQERREQRAGEAEHDQQRRDVADHEVLGHVRHQQLIGERIDRVAQRDRQRHQPGREARLPPARNRAALVRQRLHARAIRQPAQQHDDRREDAVDRADAGERERNQGHDYTQWWRTNARSARSARERSTRSQRSRRSRRGNRGTPGRHRPRNAADSPRHDARG